MPPAAVDIQQGGNAALALDDRLQIPAAFLAPDSWKATSAGNGITLLNGTEITSATVSTRFRGSSGYTG